MEENKNVNAEGSQEVDTQSKEAEDFDIKTVLDHPDFQKFMESYADKRVTEAVKTTKRKMQQQFEEEKKKAEMTQEELLQQKEEELHERELKLEKIQYFKEKNYDLDLLDFVVGGDIEEVSERADLLVTAINKVIDKQVADRLKSGYIPPRNDSKNNNNDSIGLRLAKEVVENQKSMAESQKQYFN